MAKIAMGLGVLQSSQGFATECLRYGASGGSLGSFSIPGETPEAVCLAGVDYMNENYTCSYKNCWEFGRVLIESTYANGEPDKGRCIVIEHVRDENGNYLFPPGSTPAGFHFHSGAKNRFDLSITGGGTLEPNQRLSDIQQEIVARASCGGLPPPVGICISVEARAVPPSPNGSLREITTQQRCFSGGVAAAADGTVKYDFIAPGVEGEHEITARCPVSAHTCVPAVAGPVTVTVGGCSLKAISPVTDAEAKLFEANPDRSDTTRLTPGYQNALQCLDNAVRLAGGTPSVGSAYRPPIYNAHLIEVWDKWKKAQTNTESACRRLKDEIIAHFKYHKLKPGQPPVKNSAHTRGQAVDVTITGLTNSAIDSLAQSCGLRRTVPINDPVHFQ